MTMNATHTPGPWNVGSTDGKSFIVWQDIPGRPNLPATTENKLLLAAAPDLLAAADALSRAYDRQESSPHIQKYFADLRGAVAKARGGN